MADLEVIITPPPPFVAVLTEGQGPAGPAGPVGGHYQHTQTAAAAVWTINHNLGYRPAVSILSPGGVLRVAEVAHTSINQSLAYFDIPAVGLAICS